MWRHITVIAVTGTAIQTGGKLNSKNLTTEKTQKKRRGYTEEFSV